jgi:hypothetical protein
MEKRLKNIQTFEQHSSELNISGVSDSKLYTRDEVIRLLEDLYEDVAYSYNDYGRTDFSKEAVEYVKNYMSGK